MKNPFDVSTPEYHILGRHHVATISQTYSCAPKVLGVELGENRGVKECKELWAQGKLQEFIGETTGDIMRHREILRTGAKRDDLFKFLDTGNEKPLPVGSLGLAGWENFVSQEIH
ncbi:hypothetical protein PQC07_gp145 [Aeromonas phage D3]|uniref:Uncharacterized protein n=2 Tax=Ludhianavirus TaxID=3044751 RepID=A0A514TVS7_9CAUD|nr:hypothetical protein PQC07_gp145 [Aeromonas phage D3]YP_010668877.1 hypothetical protein PQC08_gp146 [Aeromonas phage D6]QDJ97128.1 hypothetical protein D3_0130 [Aeromonas phage D3]QDJ97289.1 hypothetical protein D6_0129 [Aeromonas phage D6]